MTAFPRLASLAPISFALMHAVNALNITIYQPGVSFAPEPLPAPKAASHCDEIVTLFNDLGRSTNWTLVDKIHFEGDTGEPEGMVRIGDDRYFVSEGVYTENTVKYGDGVTINGTDRSAGAGFGHIVVYDGKGSRIADATLTQAGSLEYHNGGIDFGGGFVWATLAQYRPNTTATIVRIDPHTLEPTTILHAKDHLGGIVLDPLFEQLHTLNWGARNATTWDAKPKASKPFDISQWGFTTGNINSFQRPNAVTRNPTSFIDYQDCKWLGHPKQYLGRPMMICSGVATINNYNLGGVALVDLETMVPVSEVPIAMVSDLGIVVTMNPFDVDVVDGKLRFYFMPDQHNSTLYVYEAQ